MSTTPSYHFPTNFCLKQANICVFCDFVLTVDLPNYQQNRLLHESCPLGSSPAAPAIVFWAFFNISGYFLTDS